MAVARISSRPAARRRWILGALAAAALIAIGIAIGSRIAAPRTSAMSRVVNPPLPAPPPPERKKGPGAARNEAGAAAAAASAVELLDGPALLDSNRIRRLVGRLAASRARDSLARAYEQGSAEARARLATNSVPTPVVILRSALVGYQVQSFTHSAATVAVWRVGIVGSGSGVQPQQSWRTETVSLVWENASWKVVSFSSALGPTPPLPAVGGASTSTDLFTEIPRFQEFSRVVP